MYGNKNFIQTTNAPIKKRKKVFKAKKINIFVVILSLTCLFVLSYFLIKLFSYRKPEPVTPVVLSETAEQKYLRTLLPDSAMGFRLSIGSEMNTANQPEVAGKSGVLIELSSGNVVFNLDAKKRFPIASLVKVMTFVVALEHTNISEEIQISENAASTKENSMGLSAGEVFTLEELFYGLVLNSGNDAAVAISEGVAGDEATFVTWMNIKAKELALNDTYFADPSGLNDSSYSSAEDLVKLTAYALQKPVFKEVVATVKKELPYTDRHKYIYLVNQTNLLTSYPGVKGVKTGYTEDAGLCLITYAENENRQLVGVILDSIDRKGDMIMMLDHGFSTLGVKVIHHLLD